MHRKKQISVLVLMIGLLIPLSVQAEWVPTEPIKVYVGLAAGGGVDTVARVFVNKMAKNTGWTFTVLNVTGGGGSVALKALKKEKADGHAIIFTPSEIITFNPVMNPKIGFTSDDFTPLAAVSNTQMGLISMADKPWKNFSDAALAAKSGEKVSVAYQAAKMGIMMKLIQKELGASFTLVPVQGGSEGMQNLLGGHVDVAWGAGIQAKYVDAGQMKVLASLRNKRLQMAPDAPTMQELGVEKAVFNVKFIFAGPKDMPKEIVDTITAEIKKTAESEEIIDLIANKLALEATFIPGDELARDMKEEVGANTELLDAVKNQ